MSSSQTSAASLELVRAESQHIGEIRRICYEVFKDLHDRHHVPLLVPQRDGRVTGYLIPGLFGHGVAESEDDACAPVVSWLRIINQGGMK